MAAAGGDGGDATGKAGDGSRGGAVGRGAVAELAGRVVSPGHGAIGTGIAAGSEGEN